MFALVKSRDLSPSQKSPLDVLGLIGLIDITGAARAIIGTKCIVVETWIFLAMICLVWIMVFTRIADIIYEKKKIPGIEISVQDQVWISRPKSKASAHSLTLTSSPSSPTGTYRLRYFPEDLT